MNKILLGVAASGCLLLVGCAYEPIGVEAPSVALTATPQTLTSLGGLVTLSGVFKDRVGVTSVSITREDGGESCVPAVHSTGTFSCSATLPANSAKTVRSYMFTVKVINQYQNWATASTFVTVAAAPAVP